MPRSAGCWHQTLDKPSAPDRIDDSAARAWAALVAPCATPEESLLRGAGSAMPALRDRPRPFSVESEWRLRLRIGAVAEARQLLPTSLFVPGGVVHTAQRNTNNHH